VSTEGSWEQASTASRESYASAPCSGASLPPGILPNIAEDMGQVIALNESVTVPFGSFTVCANEGMVPAGIQCRQEMVAKGIGLVRIESTGGEVMTLLTVKHE
jgi:hypothetical protein